MKKASPVFKKKVKKSKVYFDYLELMNGKLNLTYKTCQILAKLMEIDDNWNEGLQGKKNVIDTRSRTLIQSEFHMKRSNLATILKQLKQKDLLVNIEDKRWQVNPIYKPIIVDNRVMVTFIYDIED